MHNLAILDLLADGGFHSGEEMGEILGVSRAAIWKQIKALSELGIEVKSIKSKGYQVVDGLSLLEKKEIEVKLAASLAAAIPEIKIHTQLDSTNLEGKRLLEDGVGLPGTVILAESQTAGKGRRGRRWVSPYGQNIYLSMLWAFESGARAIEGLSLAVGVATVRALAKQRVEGLSLKWPNDLLWQGRKVGGILLELTGDPAGFCQVVIGIGINVNMVSDHKEEIDQPWVSLKELSGKSLDRNGLAAAVIGELHAMLATYEVDRFTSYKDEWSALDAFCNKPVRVLLGPNEEKGIARGVTGTGELLLEIGGQLKEFAGGEVSMRDAV